MIAQHKKSCCTIFAQFFVHFEQEEKRCGIVVVGEKNLRKEKLERLEKGINSLTEKANNFERQMENMRRKKYLKQKSLAMIEKKLEKKNVELEEVREFRKKSNEKEIIAAIEKLENEKMEVIFAQVKRGIKSEKLDVTSESVLKMLGVLRENQITEKERKK